MSDWRGRAGVRAVDGTSSDEQCLARAGGEFIPDAGRTAGLILAEANRAAARRAAAGSPSGRSVLGASAGPLRRAADAADSVAALTGAAAGWVSASVGRKTVLVTVLVVLAAFLLRSLPTFDPPLAETDRELAAVWEEARSLRESPAAGEWQAFVGRALPRLDLIAGGLERSYERRLGTSLWAFAFGRSRPTEAARLDLLRVAKYDLPAVLRAGPVGGDVHEPFVEQRLGKVDEHLAGVSPYLPPLRPSTPPAKLGLASASPSSAVREGYVLAGFLGFDVLVAGGFAFVWYRRRAIA